MKYSQLSHRYSGAPINNVKMRGDQISWLRQPRPIARKIVSTFRLYAARHLHFVASNKKGPPLPNRLFSWAITKCFAWSWLHIKTCSLHFSINLFEYFDR